MVPALLVDLGHISVQHDSSTGGEHKVYTISMADLNASVDRDGVSGLGDLIHKFGVKLEIKQRREKVSLNDTLKSNHIR